MKVLRFEQTGDPWHDWGLCELYASLLSVDGVTCSKIEPSGFTLETELPGDEFSKKVASQVCNAKRWNDLHPRYEEGKKISRCAPNIQNGRRIPGEKYDPKVTKQEWTEAGLKGNPPAQVRNRCLRIPTIPITAGNFTALMDDSATLEDKNSFLYIVEEAYKGAVLHLTQSADPLIAKHHSNTKVRGSSNTNNSLSASALFAMASYCCSISPNIPFYRKQGTTAIVLLPEGNGMAILLKFWRHLKSGKILKNPDDPDGNMSTNIPFSVNGRSAHMLALLGALQDGMTVREVNDDPFSEEDLITLTDWIAIEISSGTNIRIGNIDHIGVPGGLFPLLRKIAAPSWYKWGESGISFVKDCYVGLRFKYYPLQDKIAEALFKMESSPYDCWQNLSTIAYMAYKNSDEAVTITRSSAFLLPYFYQHFAKEIIKMEEDRLEACKKIGDLVGTVFSQDVTLLSRLHNVSSPNEFRSCLELVAFRLFKFSNGKDASKSWHVSSEDFSTLLKTTDTDEWTLASQTLSAFACLKAFNQNLPNSEKKEGDSK